MGLSQVYKELGIVILSALMAATVGVVIPRHAALVPFFLPGAVSIVALYVYRRKVQSLFSRTKTALPLHAHESEFPSGMRLPRFLYFVAICLSGILIVRPAFGFTLSDWLFFVALGATLAGLSAARGADHGFLPSSLVLGAAIFAVGSTISSSISPQPEESVLTMVKFLYLSVVWFWLGTVLLRTPKHLTIAIVCWICAMALSGAASLIQAAGYGDFWSPAAMRGRFTGGADHPNDLGAQTAIVLIPALAMATVGRPKLLNRMVLVIIIGSVIIGVVLSSSGTALLTSSIALALWVVGRAQLNLKTIAGILVVAVAFVGVINVQSALGGISPFERLRANTNSTNEYCTSCERAQTSTLAIQAIVEQPVIGRGLDRIGSRAPDGHQVHVMLLKVWYESGILGFAGIVLILSSVVGTAMKNVRDAKSQDETVIAFALLMSLAAFMVVGLAQPLLFQRYAWFSCAFIIAQRAQQIGTSGHMRLDLT